MPELPEIASRAAEMKTALVGKTITGIEILQPKCLNIQPDAFTTALTNARIENVTHHGKWIFTHTSQGYLLLNLGMGGELLLVNRSTLPEKYRLIFDFADNSCLAVNFWWFGYAHFVPSDQLDQHEMTARLGPNVLDLTEDEFMRKMRGQRGRVKTLLLDQSFLAGIGNAYIHDILFLGRLHPLRQISSLSDDDLKRLWEGVQQGLRPSLELGGAYYELSLFGRNGGFTHDMILIGYREGEPCPQCGTPIQKIKTGSTSGFICPSCQPAG